MICEMLVASMALQRRHFRLVPPLFEALGITSDSVSHEFCVMKISEL